MPLQSFSDIFYLAGFVARNLSGGCKRHCIVLGDLSTDTDGKVREGALMKKIYCKEN